MWSEHRSDLQLLIRDNPLFPFLPRSIAKNHMGERIVRPTFVLFVDSSFNVVRAFTRLWRDARTYNYLSVIIRRIRLIRVPFYVVSNSDTRITSIAGVYGLGKNPAGRSASNTDIVSSSEYPELRSTFTFVLIRLSS